MKPNALAPPLLAGLLALSGCAGLGEALFERESKLGSPIALTPGKTSREEIVKQLGEPDEIDQRRLGARASEVLHYLDVTPSIDDPGHAEYRYLAMEFHKNVLAAYIRHGSGAANARAFDEFEPVAGKTTRRELEARLGAPDGKAIPPATINLTALELPASGAPFPIADIPEGVAEVWQYFGQTFDAGLRASARKTLIVFLDERGIVLESRLLRELMTKRR
jgi:hypothetical protein